MAQEETPLNPKTGTGFVQHAVSSTVANANHSQSQGVRNPSTPASIAEVVEEATDRYLDEIQHHVPGPSLDDVRAELIYRTNGSITGINALVDKSERHSKIRTLRPSQIAKILVRLKNVVRISEANEGSNASPDRQPLAVYQEEGESEGLYTMATGDLHRAIYEVEPEITTTDMRATLSRLDAVAPRVTQSEDPDLVPLNNTIYNYRTGVCTAFSPDIVLLSKTKTNLVPDAQHPYLVDNEGERFDFDEWLLDLFDGDEQRVEAVWQMIAALLRTNVSWDRA